MWKNERSPCRLRRKGMYGRAFQHHSSIKHTSTSSLKRNLERERWNHISLFRQAARCSTRLSRKAGLMFSASSSLIKRERRLRVSRKEVFPSGNSRLLGERDIRLLTELNADFSTSKMPGIYRIQTTQVLGIQSPAPQEFVFAIRVGLGRGKTLREGMTTVPITYLGKAH